jgi:hypothetical protein
MRLVAAVSVTALAGAFLQRAEAQAPVPGLGGGWAVRWASRTALHRRKRERAGSVASGSFDARDYQTRQEFSGYMGWPLLHPKALPNSSKFCTEPLVRHLPGECGSVSANWRADCSVEFWHHTCAKPMKKRCDSV